MAFTIKTTMTFAGLEQGFSESFFWTQASSDLNQAEATITPIAQKRAKLLANGYTLTVVRNSIVLNDTNQPVKRETDIFEPRLPGVVAWAPAQPNVALMCLWQTADNRFSKKQYMRGVPAGLGDSGKAPDFAFGVFGSNFNAWRAAIIALGAGWLAQSVLRSATVNSYTVDAVTGQVTFALSAGLAPWPVPVGVQTRVYVKIPGSSPLDGPLMVVHTSDTACYTAKPRPAAPLPVGQIGQMSLMQFALKTVAAFGPNGQPGQIHPQRMVTHKTGRPSYASRGRRPATVRF